MTKHLKITRYLTQQDFDDFAELSGDNNPIHVDPNFAEGSRFGATVAHGLLLCTILHGLSDKLIPGGKQISQSVVFPSPTYADRPIMFVVKILEETADNIKLTMSSTDTTTNKDTCLIETLVQRTGIAS